VNSRGERLYPGGIPLGSEPNWPLWLTGAGDAPPLMRTHPVTAAL
jgi:feruloyl esterase